MNSGVPRGGQGGHVPRAPLQGGAEIDLVLKKIGPTNRHILAREKLMLVCMNV